MDSPPPQAIPVATSCPHRRGQAVYQTQIVARGYGTQLVPIQPFHTSGQPEGHALPATVMPVHSRGTWAPRGLVLMQHKGPGTGTLLSSTGAATLLSLSPISSQQCAGPAPPVSPALAKVPCRSYLVSIHP